MKRKLPIAITIIGLLLLAVALVLRQPNTRHSWGSLSRVSVLPGTKLGGLSSWSVAWQSIEADRASNYFRSPAVMRSLSSRTGINTNKFSFGKTQPVRGCSLVELYFYADSSNNAWCVGRAASDEMLLFYATNQPDVIIELVDPAGAGRRRPWWQYALDWLRDLLPW